MVRGQFQRLPDGTLQCLDVTCTVGDIGSREIAVPVIRKRVGDLQHRLDICTRVRLLGKQLPGIVEDPLALSRARLEQPGTLADGVVDPIGPNQGLGAGEGDLQRIAAYLPQAIGQQQRGLVIPRPDCRSERTHHDRRVVRVCGNPELGLQRGNCIATARRDVGQQEVIHELGIEVGSLGITAPLGSLDDVDGVNRLLRSDCTG